MKKEFENYLDSQNTLKLGDKMQRPNFIKDIAEEFPINVKVFSKYGKNDYDKLDNLAEEKGYLPVSPAIDEKVEPQGLIGLGNSNLHCGWIATFDDYDVKAEQQIEHMNRKIKICKTRGENIIIGFCQTGKFSIGYSIYVKDRK